MSTYLRKIINEIFEEQKDFFSDYFENFHVDPIGLIFILFALFIIVIIEKEMSKKN